MRLPTATLKKRILLRIKKIPKGCWNWSGAISGNNGYGTVSDGQKSCKAHRLSYELFVGPIPKRRIIMHTCDNPICINPDHLKVATHKENMWDAAVKNRFRSVSFFRNPETHSHAKLNWEKVGKIRTLFKEQIYTYVELAKLFGIGAGTIRAIVNNKIWRWQTKEEWLKRPQ